LKEGNRRGLLGVVRDDEQGRTQSGFEVFAYTKESGCKEEEDETANLRLKVYLRRTWWTKKRTLFAEGRRRSICTSGPLHSFSTHVDRKSWGEADNDRFFKSCLKREPEREGDS